MKLLWKRNKTNPSDLPKEVQDYFTAEKRERVGVASLLALGTLCVTVLIAMGLFFGGRWVWRHPLHHGNTKQVAKVQTSDEKNASTTSSDQSDSKDPTNGSTSATPSTNSSNGSDNGLTKAVGDTITGHQTTPPAPGSSSLPNTGPTSILPVVVLTFLGSIAIAEWYQRRRLKKS